MPFDGALYLFIRWFMSHPKRILVFHRNSLFRDCLASFLAKDRGYDARAIDHGESDQVEELLRFTADILILDLSLPDNMAVDITRAIKDGGLDTRILILVPDKHEQLVECIAEGAHGCILERSTLDELEHAMAKISGGEIYCCPEIMGTVFTELARYSGLQVPKESAIPKERRLTAREQEILHLLDKRMSNKEIAAALNVSLFTVKNHVRSILDKLNVDSRIDAPDVARRDYNLGRASSPFRAR
jgi:DNA-binding NarL/FixJ family response regulator